MRWLLLLVVGLLALGVALQLWLRLAPHDFARWHGPVTGPETGDVLRVRENGATAALTVEGGAAAALARLDEVIRATPRTRVVAGTVGEGRVTYVTRTPFWSFPDVTTVEAAGDRLLVRGRQWVGRSDFGVNRDRIAGWLAAAGLPVPPEDTTSP